MTVLVFLVLISLRFDAVTWAMYDLYWDNTRHWYGAKNDCYSKAGNFSFDHHLEKWKNSTKDWRRSLDHIYRTNSSGVIDMCPQKTYTISTHDTSCVDIDCNVLFTICNNATVLCYKENGTYTTTPDLVSTTESIVTTLTDTTQAPNISDTCDNCCQKNRSRNLSQMELNAIIQELKLLVAVNKTGLSSRRRRYVSVFDSRPSCVAMGCLAIVFLTTSLALVIVPDIITLVRFLQQF